MSRISERPASIRERHQQGEGEPQHAPHHPEVVDGGKRCVMRSVSMRKTHRRLDEDDDSAATSEVRSDAVR
jgi:hypothetical protein